MHGEVLVGLLDILRASLSSWLHGLAAFARSCMLRNIPSSHPCREGLEDFCRPHLICTVCLPLAGSLNMVWSWKAIDTGTEILVLKNLQAVQRERRVVNIRPYKSS